MWYGLSCRVIKCVCHVIRCIGHFDSLSLAGVTELRGTLSVLVGMGEREAETEEEREGRGREREDEDTAAEDGTTTISTLRRAANDNNTWTVTKKQKLRLKRSFQSSFLLSCMLVDSREHESPTS